MDTDSFIDQIKTKDIHEDIADDVEKWCDTSHYGIKRPLPVGLVIGIIRDELGGKLMTKFRL